ncbi:hypothetical protein [Candidatus Cytomitobacter primus]|uniref:Uncharacterized protein n=1 Tax=Candidatus Cytomitobacter primus TaxID=2066024 RepID=A0A5C0UF38_9PROT|nr:hypothetical protein [Candidatus Cytomitobacter primus]QEK38389.1 hypothetical protein FZC34_00440 [Candidatus Cytomitobacter primus]
MPDILCISDNFLRNWPDIIGYRVIGELKLESNDLNNAKKAIKQTNPNAILWASKFGKEFKSILQFCLENEICMNILKGDEIQMPSIANCLEEKEGTIQIYDEKIILFGSNLTFLKKLFDSLSYKNEVYVFLNKKPSILNKLYFRKLFNKQIIYKYNIEKYLKENQYYLINIDGLISFTSKDKDINFLHQVEYLSKICQVHKSNFLLLMTQIYTNIPESSKQMIIAAENITQNYKGETLRLPYIAIDTRYDLYSSKFKKKLINNANISDYGSWISMDSAINKIAENLKQSQDIHIHGSFLSRNEIYHALNMIQRSWNIWPKKLDYIRGHKTCNHPISQNS